MSKVGIAGATGLVGETLVRVLESGPFEVEELRPFASDRSAGSEITFRDRTLTVGKLDPKRFDGLDVAFFCLEAGLAAKYVPEVARFCPVIDKSSHFRLDEKVPLVVPEVNPNALKRKATIIANPNCTVIPLTVAVAPLHREFGLKSLHVATYQSVSGAGRAALEQYRYETECRAMEQEPDLKESPFGPAPIAGNLIPQIGPFDSDGRSEEELKLINESRKILDLPELELNVTCVRVPVAVGHSLAVTCRFDGKVPLKKARAVLKKAKGVELVERSDAATPVRCQGNDTVIVSRVRPGAGPDELDLWVVCDNLRKGAALNAVQIAARLLHGGEK